MGEGQGGVEAGVGGSVMPYSLSSNDFDENSFLGALPLFPIRRLSISYYPVHAES